MRDEDLYLYTTDNNSIVGVRYEYIDEVQRPELREYLDTGKFLTMEYLGEFPKLDLENSYIQGYKIAATVPCFEDAYRMCTETIKDSNTNFKEYLGTLEEFQENMRDLKVTRLGDGDMTVTYKGEGKYFNAHELYNDLEDYGYVTLNKFKDAIKDGLGADLSKEADTTLKLMLEPLYEEAKDHSHIYER